MYLVDTHVVSELRKPNPDAQVLRWVGGVADRELYLSAVTIGELQAGIEKLRAKDAARAREIERWVDQVASVWNVLPMDTMAFRRCGVLIHGTKGALIADAMIAATAHIHHLTVVTRNRRDFQLLGVPTLDPFALV